MLQLRWPCISPENAEQGAGRLCNHSRASAWLGRLFLVVIRDRILPFFLAVLRRGRRLPIMRILFEHLGMVSFPGSHETPCSPTVKPSAHPPKHPPVPVAPPRHRLLNNCIGGGGCCNRHRNSDNKPNCLALRRVPSPRVGL